MRIWSRLKRTITGDPESAGIEEELDFHLEMELASGRDLRDARRRLGNPERIADQTRAVRVVPWLETLITDIRECLRQLRKSPVLALTVVFSLTMGIGMNAAIFSLIDAAVLKPLPVGDPDALVHIDWVSEATVLDSVARFNGVRLQTLPEGAISGSQIAANFHRRLAAEQTGFAALVGTSSPNIVTTVLGASTPESVRIQYVSSNFFEGLGVIPVLGRSFTAEDDQVGRLPVIVVSHRYWKSRLGGTADSIGRDVRIDGILARIIGVAPQGFFGTTPGIWTDFYAPLEARGILEPPNQGRPGWMDARYWWVHQIARLDATVPESVAVERLQQLFLGFLSEISSSTSTETMTRLATSPAGRGFDTLGQSDREALWVLQLLVALLILIVSANVANLLLSRVVGQQHAYALRRALGASRFRLLQRSFVESGLLALAGGVLGLLVGYVMARSIHDLFQYGRDASRIFALGIDLRLLTYVGGLTLVTTLLFGMVPAVRMAGTNPGTALKGRSRTFSGGSLRLPRTLVSFQFALCLVAMIAAGLLGRTMQNLTRIDIGMDAPGLTYVSVNPLAAGYTPERVGPYVNAARDALRALPQVSAASVLQYPPLSGHANMAPASVPGRATISAGPFDMTDAVYTQGVDETTLRTLGIALLSGDSDIYRRPQPGTASVVVDERFVRHFLNGGPAVGRRLQLGVEDATQYTIIGVAEAAHWGALRGDDRPVVYLPFFPDFWNAPIQLAIRADPEVPGLAAAVRAALAAVDPAVAVTELQTQEALVAQLLRTERLLALISAGFGIWAVALASVGLGGMLFYAVVRRTNEIGVRMALGAARAEVARMVLRDSFRIMGIGVAVGLPFAYGIGRLLESTLFGLSAIDPLTTAGALISLLLVAFVAAWFPAQRAARIDPIEALRED